MSVAVTELLPAFPKVKPRTMLVVMNPVRWADLPTPPFLFQSFYRVCKPVLVALSKTPFQSIQDHHDFPLDKSPFLPPLYSRVSSRQTPPWPQTQTPRRLRSFATFSDVPCDSARVLFKQRLGALLALTGSRGRCAPLPLQTLPMDRHFR